MYGVRREVYGRGVRRMAEVLGGGWYTAVLGGRYFVVVPPNY